MATVRPTSRQVPAGATGLPIALVALILLAPAAGAAAVGGSQPESISARVSIADLDLSRPEGARAAYQRLAAAAAGLCRKFVDTRTVSHWPTFVDCARDAVDATLARLDTRTRAALLAARPR
jgi:UrcA family protein